jgi:hypothetical protein
MQKYTQKEKKDHTSFFSENSPEPRVHATSKLLAQSKASLTILHEHHSGVSQVLSVIGDGIHHTSTSITGAWHFISASVECITDSLHFVLNGGGLVEHDEYRLGDHLSLAIISEKNKQTDNM